MKNKKIQLLNAVGILCALTMLLVLPGAVSAADTYPSKFVRVIIPSTPGGNNDIIGRKISAKLAERLGKNFIVENHGGAGGIIGTEKAAKAAPDGYTLIWMASTQAINPSFYEMPFDPIRDFTPIAKVITAPFAVMVHPSVPAHSLKELVALAKQKRGELLCSSPGAGTAAHLAIELFKVKAGIDFKIVQFKHSNASVTDLLGGHSHLTLSSLAGVIASFKAGTIRPLGMATKQRSVLLPDVPTCTEGGVPFEIANWWGFQAPAGTPAAVVDRLNKEIQAVLADDEIKKWLFNSGVEAGYLGPDDFGSFFQEQVATFAKVVKEANIKLQ